MDYLYENTFFNGSTGSTRLRWTFLHVKRCIKVFYEILETECIITLHVCLQSNIYKIYRFFEIVETYQVEYHEAGRGNKVLTTAV